jgi:hypothetical protein
VLNNPELVMGHMQTFQTTTDEEIGGHDGAVKFMGSDVFNSLNMGILLDEGLASTNENYSAFYAEREL